MFGLVSNRLLRPSEIAQILQISRTSAYRLIASGQLAGIRFAGKTVRVRPEDLEKFITDHPIPKTPRMDL